MVLLCSQDLKEEDGWDLYELATIAASYVKLPDETLFAKLAAAAARLAPSKVQLSCKALYQATAPTCSHLDCLTPS